MYPNETTLSNTLYTCIQFVEWKREALYFFFFWLCLEPLVSWAVFCARLLQGCTGEELDVEEYWDSSVVFFLSLCSREPLVCCKF